MALSSDSQIWDASKLPRDHVKMQIPERITCPTESESGSWDQEARPETTPHRKHHLTTYSINLNKHKVCPGHQTH